LASDLGAFCRAAWSTLHPGTKLVWNWHMDLLCEHLMLVQRRQTKRLIANVPPRTAKTSVVSICFPCWCWLQNPAEHFLCASYEIDLSTQHNWDRRRLIASTWFQSMFADRFKLATDRALAESFSNQSGGAMNAASVNSKAMGRGGSIAIVNDPLSADQAYSDALRNEVNAWFVHMLPQRLRKHCACRARFCSRRKETTNEKDDDGRRGTRHHFGRRTGRRFRPGDRRSDR
jgi:hypothetical protein